MQKEIKNWLEENQSIPFIELSQEDEFINLLHSSFASVSKEKVIAAVHQCAIAVLDKNIESFSACINQRLISFQNQ